jgi:hypothetical protein
MDRNFTIWNGTPATPIRVCRNNTGPAEVTLHRPPRWPAATARPGPTANAPARSAADRRCRCHRLPGPFHPQQGQRRPVKASGGGRPHRRVAGGHHQVDPGLGQLPGHRRSSAPDRSGWAATRTRSAAADPAARTTWSGDSGDGPPQRVGFPGRRLGPGFDPDRSRPEAGSRTGCGSRCRRRPPGRRPAPGAADPGPVPAAGPSPQQLSPRQPTGQGQRQVATGTRGQLSRTE